MFLIFGLLDKNTANQSSRFVFKLVIFKLILQVLPHFVFGLFENSNSTEKKTKKKLKKKKGQPMGSPSFAHTRTLTDHLQVWAKPRTVWWLRSPRARARARAIFLRRRRRLPQIYQYSWPKLFNGNSPTRQNVWNSFFDISVFQKLLNVSINPLSLFVSFQHCF